MIIELWEKEAHRVQALVELESEHSDLEAVLAQWTESRSEMGVFSIRAEATVFARGKAGRNKTGEARRRR
ncbi:MAG: hypothetical protein HY779_04795 [Rubrobacteridae bacterium]|nr:hypothetical protein [Rubrobacteridae bacterium]